jgi:hypothetical protein
MSVQQSKADKYLCQIVATPEIIDAIDKRKQEEGLFKEELIKAALMQLLRPYTYQIGIGHPDFVFLAPPRKAANTKPMSFWIPIVIWKKVKETMMQYQVAQNAVLYTAIYNYFILPTKQKGDS